MLSSLVLNVMEWLFPMSGPLTDQPTLEMIYAIALPGLASGMLFFVNASSGGTDIIAMIFKKYSTMDIGTALILIDAVSVFLAFFVFDVTTGLFSVCGLLLKSVFIDGVLESDEAV